MPTTTMPTMPALADALPRVEDEIRQLATSSTLPIVNTFSGRITAAGGKRLRSVVMLAGSLALSGEVTGKAVTAAACVELLHAGSLVHDDLMDNAVERRGVRTVNAEWGTGPAVLVGDFMLARASQAALDSISPFAAGKLAAAVTDLVEGQVLEVLDLYDVHRSPDSALRSIALKTGALFRVGCVLAAHCAEASEEVTTRLSEYGAHFGLLFQILDDLLDLASTSDRLGKPAGNDIRQGVYTFPLLRALTEQQRELLAARGRELADAELEGLLRELRGGRLVAETLAYCRGLAAQTVRALPELPESEALGILRELPMAYLEWAGSQIG
ncbi:heptaprenyl diphosphate synthase/octaprenyl-diphosphate synthase [Saccharothrix tamanrassetensis]|uniref:Heptaprenyl diphosphate synthase/octaprenyl-diphosphate synthase n=1 Tax=Saccharothrix tamanrassetensis TaxID=1051531 RepID=A0A841CGG8_9PSEU|nr:polyprenyl synthetase family protein [Saccharothrix tamanrassetensis]MBB5956093.1 heptaprenyl diphosphate synthase/octaprenyl-diphosphate synthase [Saccharothrix tamanrassetensis]